MTIRPASLDDFVELYAIGRNTPELRVSATEEFMDADEFRWSLTHPNGIFLVAEEEKKLCGFIYASANDAERPFEHKYACIVYVAVLPEYRRQGLAQKLYQACERRLKKRGITHVYGWANQEGQGGIIEFLKKHGFEEGHRYVWMDKKL